MYVHKIYKKSPMVLCRLSKISVTDKQKKFSDIFFFQLKVRSAKSLKVVRVLIFELFYKAYILKLLSHTCDMSNTYISSSSKLKTMYLSVLLSIKEKFNWSLIIYFDNWTKQKSSTWMRKVLKLLKLTFHWIIALIVFWYIFNQGNF